MSGLAGLNQEFINFITRGGDMSDATRAEVRNFLMGRVTTVNDTGEFGNAIKRLAPQIEQGSTEAEGSAMGEILGALEGGALVEIASGAIIPIKAAEIFSELLELGSGTPEETQSRIRLRNQIERERERGVIHGSQGTPSRSIDDLQRQIDEQRAEAIRKRGEFKGFEDVKLDDPIRPRRPTVTDEFPEEETPLMEGKAGQEPEGGGKIGAGLAGAAAGLASGVGSIVKGISGGTAVPPTITLKPTTGGGTPVDKPEFKPPEDEEEEKKRKRKRVFIDPPDPEDEKKRKQVFDIPSERENPESNEQQSEGEPLLRPSFKQVGTDFFDKMYDTPLNIQNSEWAEYDFVPLVDRQNHIKMDNIHGEALRFQAPLYYPKYQKPLKPPSKQAIFLSRVPMKKEIQLTQPFVDKFDGAEMGRPIDMTLTYNHSVFDANFKNLRIYNPI